MQKYKIFALTLVHFLKKTYLRAAMSLGRLGLYRSFHICSPSLSCRTFRACGEIGRRARLRIWWFMPCRFESYQAHHNPPPTASQKPSGIFLCPESPLQKASPMRGSAQSRIAVKDCGLIIKHASGSRALPLYGGDGGGSLGLSGGDFSSLLSLLPQLTQ